MGDSGVLSLELPLELSMRSPSPAGLRGEVGDVGERGPAPQGVARGGGRPGEAGEEGEGTNKHSSLGVRTIFILNNVHQLEISS